MAQELSNKVLGAVVPGSALGLDRLSEFLLPFTFSEEGVDRQLYNMLQFNNDSYSIACVYLLSIVSRMLVACNKIIVSHKQTSSS